ncbi:hypothetical protein GF415_04105 [Candidatus Micrarchaeota archaeon]|nr:hypothetical protein [Candidatus Micrarchaeota archaeon]
MRTALFILCFVALVFPMSVELEEKTPYMLEYRIEERGAYDANLTLVFFRDGTQIYAEEIQGFNGLHEGELQVLERGTYTLKAYDTTTGDTGETALTVSELPSGSLAESAPTAELQEEYEDASTTLEQSGLSWLPYLIILLFVFLVALLLFGNPFKKKKK